jgi:hypothetical protein
MDLGNDGQVDYGAKWVERGKWENRCAINMGFGEKSRQGL